MSFTRRTRRNGQNNFVASAVKMDAPSETLETRQLLSGNPVSAPGAVVDKAIEDHASGQVKKNAESADAAANAARENADAEQSALEDVREDAATETAATQANANAKRQEADAAQTAADEAKATQQEHERQAQEDRDAQAEAREDIEGPAILKVGNGGEDPLNELTEEELAERRRNAEVYLHNSDLNNPDGNFTPWEQWGRSGREAEIHEIDAELARRDAEAKQKAADEARQEADQAQQDADATKADWDKKVQDQETKAAAAATAAEAAENAAQDARDAAAADAKDNLDDKVRQAEQDLEEARKAMLQKLRDLQKAMYFARLLGLTPDSFTAEKMEQWQQKMEELIEWVEVADDFDMLPATMADVIKIATEAITGIITGLRDIRLQQMEFEMDGIELGNERNGMSNGTASDWLQDDKHGNNAAEDDEEARRLMRILVGWNKNGIDLSGCMEPERTRVQAAEDRRNALRCQKSQLADAMVQQTAANLNDALDLNQLSDGYWDNWSGLNEKWIRANDGWLFILPGGEVHRWQGGRFENLQSTQIATLDARYHTTPALLHDAEAVAADQEFQLRFTGSYHTNWGGQNEKWMLGRTNWFWLNTEGELFRWNRTGTGDLLSDSTRVADGLDEFWSHPEHLHDAAELFNVR